MRAHLLVALLLLLCGRIQAQDVPIDGMWNIVLGSYGGKSYFGTLDIEPAGEQYAMRWTVDGGNLFGVGLYQGNNLYAGWGTTSSYGVIVYDIARNGTLSGVWTLGGNDGSLGSEKAIGGSIAKAKSTFTVSGTNPGTGSAYTGSLTITKVGETYRCDWTIGDDTFTGVGLRVGEKLVVGWGRGEGEVGVATYAFTADKGDGTWAIPGSSTIGDEDLARPLMGVPGK